MYMRWADLVTVWEVLYVSNFIQNWNWWEVLYMSNLIQTLYLRSCGKFWRQRWMLHSKLDTGNKLSTQTPSSAQWMGTRGHLKSAFTCVVIWISGAMWAWCVKMPTQNLLRLLLLLMLMLRIMLATVCCRFGSWGLIIKQNFCLDFEHKVWSRFWSWSSGMTLKLEFGQYFAADVL